TLGMDILRAKTPEMVRTELWSCLLVYNLLRESMLRTAMKSAIRAWNLLTWHLLSSAQ
ncbi:MAG: hypothetical protein RLY70_4333, partial [Planctomycetota bacterium]